MSRHVFRTIVVAWLVTGCTVASPSTPPAAPPDSPGPTAGPTLASAAPSAAATPDAPPVAMNEHWETVANTPVLNDIQAVQLGDGRVLVMGWDVGIGRSAALLWDPADGSWTSTATLDRPRSSSALLALADGRALVVGGFNERDASYSSVYAYEPSDGSWTKAGVMHTARTNPAVALLDDGRVLIAGGYFWQRPQDAAAIGAVAYAAFRSGPSASTPTPRPFDDVDVPPHGYALATAELFDPESGTFENTGPMRYARPGAAITVLADGRVLVVGAAPDDVTGVDQRAFETAEVFDPATGRFELTDPLPAIDAATLEQPGRNPIPDEAPSWHDPGALVSLADGGALLVAQSNWWKHVADLSRSFRLDADARTWTEVGDTFVDVWEPTEQVLFRADVPFLQGAVAALIPGDRVLVAGGEGPVVRHEREGSTDTSAVARVFDAADGSWATLPPMPQPRRDAVSVSLDDGSVLVLGGNARGAHESVDLPFAVRFVPGR